MKIKSDFITNSSSTSYVFCVQKEFNLHDFLLKNIDSEDEYNENLIQAIGNLLENRSLFEIDYPEEFKEIESMLDVFKIAGFDTGPDMGELRLIYIEEIEEKIKNSL